MLIIIKLWFHWETGEDSTSCAIAAKLPFLWFILFIWHFKHCLILHTNRLAGPSEGLLELPMATPGLYATVFTRGWETPRCCLKVYTTLWEETQGGSRGCCSKPLERHSFHAHTHTNTRVLCVGIMCVHICESLHTHKYTHTWGCVCVRWYRSAAAALPKGGRERRKSKGPAREKPSCS